MQAVRRRIAIVVLGAGLAVAPAGIATAGASAAGTKAPAAAVTTGWPVVKKGATGERVRGIQLLLKQRVGAKLNADGIFGSGTVTAVKSFQKKYRLAVDGYVGSATWSKLIITVRTGSRGNAVTAVQRQLRYRYGYKSVVVDGIFGRSTATAVKSFQKKYKLASDGVVGSSTWKALETH